MDRPKKRQMITEGEAAKELGVSKETLANWRDKGDAPRHYILGPANTVRYNRSDVIDWRESRASG